MASDQTNNKGDAAAGGAGVSGRLGRIVGGIARHAGLVLLAAFAVTAVAGWGATTLGVNTDTTDLLSRDLTFRKTFAAYRRDFPWFGKTLVIVIDGDTVDSAEAAGRKLYQRLQKNQDRYRTIFYPQGDPFFRRHGLLYLETAALEKLSDRITQAQPLIADLNRDPTLRGLFSLLAQAVERLGGPDGKPALIRPVVDRISGVIEARLAGKPRALPWEEVFRGGTITERDRRRVIVVQPELDFASLSPAQNAMNQIRAWAREMGLSPEAGVRVRLTGSTAINSEELKTVTEGVQLAGWISLALVSLLLFAGLQSVRLVVAVLITLILGLIWTAGFAALAVGTLNLISVAFAVLFIGLGVDFGIHFALRCREESQPDKLPDTASAAARRHLALSRAAAGVGAGLILSAAAAAVAFLSFLPTDYRGVSELGLIAGAGMAVALLASLTVLPAILALWPEGADLARRPSGSDPDAAGDLTATLAGRYRRYIVGIAVILALGGAALTPFATFDRNPLNLKDPNAESVSTAVELSSDADHPVTGISIVAPDLEAAVKLAKELRSLPAVRGARTIRDFLPSKQQEKLDVIEELSLLMLPVLRPQKPRAKPTLAQQRAAAQALETALAAAVAGGKAGDLKPAAERLRRALAAFRARAGADPAPWAKLEADLMGGLAARLAALREALSAGPVAFRNLPASLRSREISADGKARIFVTAKGDLRDADVLRAFVDQVTGVAPNATGAPVVEHRAGDEVVKAFSTATGIAFVMIALALLLLMRRPVEVALVLTPVLIAGALTIGITVVFDIPFNFANIIVVPLLIGLGVASGIHLVLRARKDGRLSMASSTPRAVLFSALTTVASFGSLAVSPHRGTASMGELLMIAISLTLICALVVLPALLGLVRRQTPDSGSPA